MHLLRRNPSRPRDSHWIALEILAPGPGLVIDFLSRGPGYARPFARPEVTMSGVPPGVGGPGLAMTGA